MVRRKMYSLWGFFRLRSCASSHKLGVLLASYDVLRENRGDTHCIARDSHAVRYQVSGFEGGLQAL